MSKAWAGGTTASWRRIRRVVLERDGYRCQIRGEHCKTIADVVDHIVPKSQGGTDNLNNLRAACRPCNSARSDKPIDPAPLSRW